jgi:uncharacterized membrane protein
MKNWGALYILVVMEGGGGSSSVSEQSIFKKVKVWLLLIQCVFVCFLVVFALVNLAFNRSIPEEHRSFWISFAVGGVAYLVPSPSFRKAFK